MSRLSRSTPLVSLGLLASLAFSASAASVDAPKDEFTAKASDYDTQFSEASAAIKQIILDEGFEVVGVADFTDLAGQPLQIGRLYAEEFATRLVGPRKKYRLLDPATLLGLVEANGGTSLWATPEKIRQFGDKSNVELVVTGRIEIAAKEARFFIKAVATEDAGVVWAKTIAVPGISAAAAEAAAEAAALAAQAKLVVQPLGAETGAALSSSVAGAFTAPSDAAASPTNPTPASTPTMGASIAAAAPAASSAAPYYPAPTSSPAANPQASGAPAAGAALVTAAVASQAATSPSPPAPAAAAPAPKPTPPAPAASSTGSSGAPLGAGAAAATAAVATAAIVTTSNPQASAPKPAAAPAPPTEVLTFENAWLRARVRSASKYEGSGWVTAVLDLTNLSDRPIKLDAAQDDPGKGVDELGNNWRIERVSGLKLASGSGTVNTTLNPSSTVSVVVVLATTANPSGRRLSFGPNLYWFGSAASGDSGRVAVAFSNIRVN